MTIGVDVLTAADRLKQHAAKMKHIKSVWYRLFGK